MTSFSPPAERSLGAPSTSVGSFPSIRVFLADDHPAVRLALRGVIEAERGMDVCGEAASSNEALRQIEGLAPDVAVLDISLEDAHGLDLVESLQAFASDTEALIYSMFEEEAYAVRAVHAGASGYLEKSEPPEKVPEAIRTVAEGEIYLSSRMFSQTLKQAAGRLPVRSAQSGPNGPAEALSDRELEVFQMLGLGYSLQEIQERLSLARKTVETYRRGARHKLGCETPHELYQRAVQWTDGQASLPKGPTSEGPSNNPDAKTNAQRDPALDNQRDPG